MAQGTIIQFVYNGTFRQCKVVADCTEYVKAENLPCNGLKPERQFSNYAKNKIDRLLVVGLTTN